MSKTYKDRGYQRKKVRNSFLQKICICYSDDFKGRRSKKKYKNKMIRQRIKRLYKEIVNESENEKMNDYIQEKIKNG